MSQADYNISDQPGAGFLSELNGTLAAIVSQNSGPTEPSPTYAYQLWADTATGILKQRNASNSGWVSVLTMSNGTPVGIGTTIQAYDADIPTVAASQAEMEAGTESALRSMSPLRVAQAIAAHVTPGAFFESANLIITNNSGQSVAHGLGAIPKNFQAVLRCVAAEYGYAVRDEVIVPSSDGQSGVGDFGCIVSASSTSLYVSTFGSGIRIANKSTWAKVTITNAKWRFVLRAWSR